MCIYQHSTKSPKIHSIYQNNVTHMWMCYCTHTHTHTHTHAHTHMQSVTHTHTQSVTYIHTHTHMHSSTHTRSQSRTHTHTQSTMHTQTHTRMQSAITHTFTHTKYTWSQSHVLQHMHAHTHTRQIDACGLAAASRGDDDRAERQSLAVRDKVEWELGQGLDLGQSELSVHQAHSAHADRIRNKHCFVRPPKGRPGDF